MRQLKIILAGLVMACLAPYISGIMTVSAQQAAVGGGAASGMGQTYELKYNWDVGATHTFKKYIEAKLDGSTEGRKDSRIHYTETWNVARRDIETGLFTIKQKISDYNGGYLDLRSFGLSTGGEDIEKQVDQNGRVASVVHYNRGSRFFVSWLVLPLDQIQVGEKWRYKPTVIFGAFERPAETTMNIVYTLEKVTPYRDSKSCAKIRIEGNYGYSSEDNDFKLTGGIGGYIYLDLQKGMLVDYQIQETREAKVISTQQLAKFDVKITSIAQ